ncbi:hypothetical protein K432DRAFT_397985 [Lepidopterella palustris CBS 459.81]|uniref:Uncharacterized protein n=1 Tax=Lepidopterella palustris CBS 459.81 TaxID=1314670 RepID=A0A8E2J9M7_9PEZI|nr:hypothetical protein K432DRAFT_397985 [Lepidopterella palustris CBS 459.81]
MSYPYSSHSQSLYNFDMTVQSTQSNLTPDGYILDPNAASWLESDTPLEYLSPGEPPRTTPSSDHDSEATLVGSPDIIDVIVLLHDVKQSIEGLKREVSEDKDTLLNLREICASIQKDTHQNSSALSNIDEFIKSLKQWTWDFKEDVQRKMETFTKLVRK